MFHSYLDITDWIFWSAEANEKEADKIGEQLQNTGISSGASDGAATSG